MAVKRLFNIQLGFLALLVSFSPQAFAVGEAGCGPGSIVFTKNSFVSQSLAHGLNAISSPFKFGAVLSGSSNCTAKWSHYQPLERERMQYVADNFRALQSEIAAGRGEALDAMWDIHGCGSQQNARALSISGAMLQPQFDAEKIAVQSRKLTQFCKAGDPS